MILGCHTSKGEAVNSRFSEAEGAGLVPPVPLARRSSSGAAGCRGVCPGGAEGNGTWRRGWLFLLWAGGVGVSRTYALVCVARSRNLRTKISVCVCVCVIQ